MAPEVEQTIADIYQTQTGKSKGEADQGMVDPTAEQRYRIDVWGSG